MPALSLSRRLTFAATLSLVLVAAASADVPSVAVDLPQLGEPADLILSPAEEAKLGAQVAAELYSGDYLVEDPEITDYVNSVGLRLAAKGAANAPGFRFFVIGDPRINAFAVPGGLIGINAGLILAASNESELAGVLGHEQAHVTQRHLARTVNDTRAANIATWAAMIAAVLAGSANPDLIFGALALGQSINAQREVNYTRAHELEADRIGIRTMSEAGYDPEAMASFFAKLEQQSRLYGAGLPEILRTHPVNTTRVAEARSRAAQLPKPTGQGGAEFALMKARTEVFMAARPNEALELFANRLQKVLPPTPVNQYGYAVALYQVGRYQDALTALNPALAASPRQVNLNLLQGQLLVATGKPDEGLAVLGKALALHPRYAPAALVLARAQLDAGKPADARLTLLARDPSLGLQPETHKLLAQSAQALGNIAETQFQNASFDEQRGDLRGALSQLDAGLRLSSLSSQDRARLQAMRQNLIDHIPRDTLAEIERDRRRYSTLR